MADPTGQAAACITRVINPNKTKSLAFTIKQHPALDSNQLCSKRSMATLRYVVSVSFGGWCKDVDTCRTAAAAMF